MTRRTATRSLAAIVVAVALLSTCGRSSELTSPASTDVPTASDKSDNGRPDATPKASRRPSDGQPAPGVVATSSPQRGEPPSRSAVVPTDDEGPVGANALPYLRETSPKLVIELNAVAGKQPRQAAVNLLRSRLSAVVDKPQGVELLPTRTFGSSSSSYTMDDVGRLEKKHRRRYSDDGGGVVVMHVLYLNGFIREAEGALGLAYRSSSIVMLPDQIAAASNPLLAPERIEEAALVHEAGHLLGLVNIGYRSPRDHEDPDHNGHSRNRRSVMYWAIETLDVANILAGRLPNSFDGDDLADLEDRKAGRI